MKIKNPRFGRDYGKSCFHGSLYIVCDDPVLY